MNTSKKITLVFAISLLMPCTHMRAVFWSAEAYSLNVVFAYICSQTLKSPWARAGMQAFCMTAAALGIKEGIKEIITHYYQEKNSNSLKKETLKKN